MPAALEGAFRRDVRRRSRATSAPSRQRCARRTCASWTCARGPCARATRCGWTSCCCSRIARSARTARCCAFFGEGAWTARRWTRTGTLRVDLWHMRWREVQYVLRYLYGAEEDVFDAMEDVGSADELVDAVFGVMAVANELLLDRMVLLCSRVIQQRITIANATSILAEASLFHATALVQSVQGYIASNLETLLERRLLDALPADLVKQLAAFVRAAQEVKAPVARTGAPHCVGRRAGLVEPRLPGPVHPAEKRTGVVEVVDDERRGAIPPLSLSAPVQPTRAAPVGGAPRERAEGWKVPGAAPKADMKAIMAETALSGVCPAPAGSSVPRSSAASEAANWRTPQRKTFATPLAENAPRMPAGGSPWKPVQSVSSANLAAGGSLVQPPPMTPTMRAKRARDEWPPPP
ncbi:hypothetical protein PsYK624_066610 [Phanerochaete sordida]|uniref:BTB domain-containing protein n=1 Tax=Phanerochaete sordida TaxID=48140 RepID=A0A9P3LCH9_9APHY|nr:hypothetical protein PsYK624_066610 [Phanerochaete sordida]